jgi:hypothetical protein
MYILSLDNIELMSKLLQNKRSKPITGALSQNWIIASDLRKKYCFKKPLFYDLAAKYLIHLPTNQQIVGLYI